MKSEISTQANSILGVTLLVTLLSVAGIALPYPILAPLFEEGLSPLTHFMSLPKELLFGIVIGIYPLGVIIGSSFIGALSDRQGRKRVLTITMFGSSISYVLTAMAVYKDDYLLFCLSRFITGLLEGNVAIARAIAIDLHPTIHKTKSLSWISAMGFGGYLVGPLAGGQLASQGIDVVFLWAALACFIATLCCYFLLPNTLNRSVHNAEKGSSLILLKEAPLRRFFLIYFLLMLGINIYYEFYPVWLVEKLSYDPSSIGWATVFITSCMLIQSTLLNPKLQEKVTTAKGSLIGMSFVASGLFIMPIIEQSWFWISFALIGMGVAIYNGFLTSYISTAYEDRAQGSLMGMMVTIFCVGNLAAAAIGTLLLLIKVDYTLIFASLSVILACLMFYRGHYKLTLWGDK
ncbi:MFS transporter [Shewanella sp. OPT22]|nr:MFS transporter [Shewanella sp. OPT22]